MIKKITEITEITEKSCNLTNKKKKKSINFFTVDTDFYFLFSVEGLIKP